MRYFSYVVARDYGFAPNPFNGYCTLATCKPRIRHSAKVGDWVFGTGSSPAGLKENLIYAMRVTEKMTFNEYWDDQRFQTKKPLMKGCSLKKMYGDNVYHFSGRKWHQADSHHSLEGGRVNRHNLERDTSVDAVLISSDFYYFGRGAVRIPKRYLPHIVKSGPGYRCPDEAWGERLVAHLRSRYSPGYHEDPIAFDVFNRYDGTS